MEEHISFLKTSCRLCGNQVKGKSDVADKQSFKSELWLRFQINVDVDDDEIHPSVICPACKRVLYRIRGATDPSSVSTSKQPFLWRRHDQDCYCLKKRIKVGRPSKKKPKNPCSEKVEGSGSDTESGEESEVEHEKDSCQQFRNLMQNIEVMDKDLALVCAENLSKQFNFIFLDRENMDAGIKNLTVEDRMLITSTIFSSEKQNVKNDIASCSQTYKHLPVLLQVTPHGWVQARNSVLTCAINSLCHENAKPFEKAVATDQLYSLVSPSFVSPLLFATNLLAYSVTRSKLALNINGKLHPAGGHRTVRNWLNSLTMTVPHFPSGDVLTAIDNDQVLIKKWTVRKDNRAQISVLTSVCVAQISPHGTLQLESTLAPRTWSKRVKVAKENPEERTKLIEACSPSETDKNIIRHENKQLIHEILKELLQEQTKTPRGWKDDVDLRVEEIEAKEGRRVCPVCLTVMERSKRKCINPECKVSLKSAEKEVQGSDILGTALVAPIRQFHRRVKETHLGFVIDDKEEAHVMVKEQISECNDEFQHVPSNHPSHPVKVVAGDPVFVNPNSQEALKEVLRRVGKAANVKRYNPSDPCARQWLNVTMDGLPYLVCRKVIETVLLCTECGDEVTEDSVTDHCLKDHNGQKCSTVSEFDWVVLRIGKLHYEMNMARHFIDLNWAVFLSKLASELGFVSEAAQKFVRKGSDHHKTMSVLRVCHMGLWRELLIPYIRDRLNAKLPISVSDYLYKWMPEVGWKNATYNYIFGMTWTYLMAIHVFRMGVRRNNSTYVRAGQMCFSSLFHRSAVSKYAMIDLHDSVDRACYPEDLGRFVQSTESISTSGNASKGEDMDACLEEVNKDSKVWQHGSMVAMDWLRIFRNLENLSKVRNWLFSIIGLQNPKDEAADSQRKYDFQDEVLAWRIKLRKEKYLQGGVSDVVTSLDGTQLDNDLGNYEETLKSNRLNLFNKHFIDGEKRPDVSVKTLYVTAEERAVAEDIKNGTKDEILRRMSDKIEQISDEEIREPLSQKLEHFRKHIGKSKKEILVLFYNEILEELQQSQAQQETAFVVEGEGQSE